MITGGFNAGQIELAIDAFLLGCGLVMMWYLCRQKKIKPLPAPEPKKEKVKLDAKDCPACMLMHNSTDMIHNVLDSDDTNAGANIVSATVMNDEGIGDVYLSMFVVKGKDRGAKVMDAITEIVKGEA